MFQFTAWALPSLVALLAAGATGVRLWPRRPLPGVVPLLVLCVCVGLWAAGQLLGILRTDLAWKLVSIAVQAAAAAFLPVCWLAFALTYARQSPVTGWRALLPLSLLPLVTLAIALAPPLQALLWRDVELVQVGDAVGVAFTRGPWYDLMFLYNVAVVSAGTAILTFVLAGSIRHRRALWAVVAAPAITILLILLRLLPWSPVLLVDLAPLGLAIGAVLLTRGVIDSGALDLVPQLRSRLVEQLADPIIVVDGQGLVADANASALALLASGRAVIGQPIGAVVGGQVLPLLKGAEDSVEFSLADRAFHVRATEIRVGAEPASHRALVFRDITERLVAERALREVQAELETLAHTDSLTGLHNRRYFMQRLAEDVARVDRHGRPLALLVFDLDQFKQVNDRHGHTAGDRLLVAVADAARRIKRSIDVAARLGGEEFALLLPDTDLDGAHRMAERLRTAVAAAAVPGGRGETVAVTTSIGVAALRPAEALDDLLMRADHALYAAKHAGRNRVCSSDAPSERSAMPAA